MYEGNAPIDRPTNDWTPETAERLFIFCQFDRAMPYEKVVAAYNFFLRAGYFSFNTLRPLSLNDLTGLMVMAGLRFPKETAKYLYENVRKFDGATLMQMSRDDLAKRCEGFGMKLASMFYNRVHNAQYAIIDVHIDRYLREHGCTTSNYKKKEEFFAKLAKEQGKTPEELDWEIWDKSRIGNRVNP